MRYALIAFLLLVLPAHAADPTEDELEMAAAECAKKAIPMGRGPLSFQPGYEACTHIFELWFPIQRERQRVEQEKKSREMHDLINRLGK